MLYSGDMKISKLFNNVKPGDRFKVEPSANGSVHVRKIDLNDIRNEAIGEAREYVNTLVRTCETLGLKVRFAKPTYGGLVCVVLLDNELQYCGFAQCSTDDDYNLHLGQALALWRATCKSRFGRKLPDNVYNYLFFGF